MAVSLSRDARDGERRLAYGFIAGADGHAVKNPFINYDKGCRRLPNQRIKSWACCPDIAVPVGRRVHRLTLMTYKFFFIEGLSIFEHVVSSYSEFVGNQNFGFAKTVFAFKLLVVFFDVL